MALFNEINAGRIARGLQKITGIKGSPPVKTLASDLMPVFPLPVGEEFRYLEGWNIFGWTGLVAAGGAGTQNHIRLRNPAGSHAIVVLAKLDSYDNCATNDSITFRYTAADPSDLGSVLSFAQNMDARAGGNARSSVITTTSETSAAPSLVGTPIQVILVRAQTGSNIDLPYILIPDVRAEIVLAPGSALDILTGGNNALRVTARWRERFLEDSELT